MGLIEDFFGYLIVSAITFGIFLVGAIIFSIKVGALELIISASIFSLIFYALYKGVNLRAK